jgi:isopenicillin N synthase-like dioxygenase
LARFPIVDIEKYFNSNKIEKDNYSQEVDAICRNSGFLAIKNHGIDQPVIEGIWNATERFFSLSSNKKNESKAPFDGYPYGYLGPGKEALAASKGMNTPPDLKESFNGGPILRPANITDSDALSFCYADTIWPNSPVEFKSAWIAYYQQMEILASKIMQLFATALRLEEKFFDPYIDQPISALRALNYPAQKKPPEIGQLRAGAHSDYGSLTILLPEENSVGLEILTLSGQWELVPAIPNTFIINIGDLMARWTNDRWISTLHRVVNKGSINKRQSLAYFHQPNWNAEIQCLSCCLQDGELPKYPPVKSGPYLMEKFKSTNR